MSNASDITKYTADLERLMVKLRQTLGRNDTIDRIDYLILTINTSVQSDAIRFKLLEELASKVNILAVENTNLDAELHIREVESVFVNIGFLGEAITPASIKVDSVTVDARASTLEIAQSDGSRVQGDISGLTNADVDTFTLDAATNALDITKVDRSKLSVDLSPFKVDGTTLPEYKTGALAVAGGLTSGKDLYKDNGTVKVAGEVGEDRNLLNAGRGEGGLHFRSATFKPTATSGVFNLKWLGRVILISMDDDGEDVNHVDITVPVGTIGVLNTTAVTSTAEGIPMTSWQSLWVKRTPINGGFAPAPEDFLITRYNSPFNLGTEYVYLGYFNADILKFITSSGQVIGEVAEDAENPSVALTSNAGFITLPVGNHSLGGFAENKGGWTTSTGTGVLFTESGSDDFIVVPRSGRYLTNVSIYIQAGSTTNVTRYGLHVRRNGVDTPINFIHTYPTASDRKISSMREVTLLKGELLLANVNFNDLTVYTAPNHTEVQLTRIGD